MSNNPTPFAGLLTTQQANWLPGDNNLLAATSDPNLASAGTLLLVAGTQYLRKIPIRSPITITNVWFMTSAAGSGASTGSFAGLISPAGAILSGSADCAAQFTAAANPQQVALTTPQAVVPPFVWVVLLSNLATTQPTLRCESASAVLANLDLTNATLRVATNGTALTALTAITPSANAFGAAPWVGVN